MIRIILAALWKPVAAIFGLWAIRADAKRDQRRETALQAAERYAKTRKALDDADQIVGDDPAASRRWLHERGQ